MQIRSKILEATHKVKVHEARFRARMRVSQKTDMGQTKVKRQTRCTHSRNRDIERNA